MGKLSSKAKDFLEIFLWLGILIFSNIIASQYFFRVDLSEDKRYSISPTTKEILKDLDDVVHIEVYLEGEFPAGFTRLQKSIRETLDEFKIYGGKNIQYKFINPSAETDEKVRSRIYMQLAQKGIQPTNLFAKEGDKKIEKLIFPGATVSYKEKEVSVMLLKGNKAAGPAEILNQSVEGVEYELISAIRQLSNEKRKSIAFIEGHGELSPAEVSDLSNSLKTNYNLYHIDFSKVENLENYDAVIIAKPKSSFTDKEKFILDQFIVKGGRALFFIDALAIEMDSIKEAGAIAVPYGHNLNDLLFKYGLRLNANLIQDLNSGFIPMVTGFMGNNPKTEMVNWKYFPLINNFGNHSIVKNLDAVYTRFVGSIDSVKADKINKIPLLLSSQYSKLFTAPVNVNFNQARAQVNPASYNQGKQPVAFLLEGKFSSAFKNRPSPIDGQQAMTNMKTSRLIVCSDGDILRNDINKKTGEFLPLGYDLYSRQKFANKDFVMNSIDYLLDEKGIVNIRAKEIKLRPLDKVRIEDERVNWQILNIIFPVLLVLLLGVLRFYFRKRSFEKIISQ